MKPIDYATEAEKETGTMVFQPSSRVIAMRDNRSKSIGASCNTFSVADNVESIGEAAAWGISVLAYQGAPSWDLSNLRPIGSQLGTHGTSSGATSFGRVFDSIVSQMRREEKKNGAGILGLDYKHHELNRFLSEPYKSAYKMVYLPMHDTSEAEELLKDTKTLEYLADAFNTFKTFLVKRPLPLADGTELLLNLCTEVEIPNKGFCVLGAINLSYFTPGNVHWIVDYFRMAAQKMVGYEKMAHESSHKAVNLGCPSKANRQFGLGIYGLASVLGAWDITYREFNTALAELGVGNKNNISKIAQLASAHLHDKNRALLFCSNLIHGYFAATKIAEEAGMRAAFCIQPTVSTSQRSFDAYGYNVSAEVQPVDGIKHEEGVSYLRKSAIKGDKVEVCHPGTWTTDEVSYSTYALTSSLLQQLMDSTGLAHRHSHCFYGEKFTAQDLIYFYIGDLRHRKSLYYRLPFTNNVDSLRKDRLWQDVGESELYDGDLSDIMNTCQLPTDGGGEGCQC